MSQPEVLFVICNLFVPKCKLTTKRVKLKMYIFRKIFTRRRARLLVVVLIAFIVIYEVLSPQLLLKLWSGKDDEWHDSHFHFSTGKGKHKNEIIVLRWTTHWDRYEDVRILDQEKCPYLNFPETSASTSVRKIFDVPCRITFDRRYLESSDVLTFHSYDLYCCDSKLPKVRSPEQPWVYVQQECPTYTMLNLKAYPNVFNWTMTYRRDSDVYHPYGHIIPHSDSSSENDDLRTITSQLKNRTGLVAWVVSRCDAQSKRHFLVKQLQKYINISVYGSCGTEKCPSEECYAHVSLTHKFYLSFENSLCSDYITEKFFDAVKFNMVPIVYGGERSSDYFHIAPKGSYVDVRDFKSPKELAQYLIYLDKNDDEYLKYFEWKRTSKVVFRQGWCNLCQRVYEHVFLDRIHQPVENDVVHASKQNKVYKNLWKWWNYFNVEIISSEVVSNRSVKSSSLDALEKNSGYNFPACAPELKRMTRDGINVKRISLNVSPAFFNWRTLINLTDLIGNLFKHIM